MPHLTFEYTDNRSLDANALLRGAHERLAASGRFIEVDIKSRAQLHAWRVGTDGEIDRGFAHAMLALLPGRSDAIKAELSTLVLDALRQHLPASRVATQLCVSVEELHGPAYARATVEPTVSPRP